MEQIQGSPGNVTVLMEFVDVGLTGDIIVKQKSTTH